MDFVNIQFAKTYLSKLLARVMNGEEIVIASRGQPFAKIVRYQQGRSRAALMGIDEGQIIFHEDALAPVSQEYLEPFYEK